MLIGARRNGQSDVNNAIHRLTKPNHETIMPAKAKSSKSEDIKVMQVRRGRIEVCVLGTSPLIFHCMSQKASRELLLPSPKKKASERATTLKHNPLQEFRDSIDKSTNPNAPTVCMLKTTAFKAAMCSSAIDIPGSASRAAIGRLAYVDGDWVHIYGIPLLRMDVVRMADINKTPDIRTRATCVEWACRLSVTYTEPVLKKQAVLNLLAGAGITQGVGDFRTQKGKGNYGCFELVDEDNKDFQRILKLGRVEQQLALESPSFHDDETAQLYNWFVEEAERRELKIEPSEEEAA